MADIRVRQADYLKAPHEMIGECFSIYVHPAGGHQWRAGLIQLLCFWVLGELELALACDAAWHGWNYDGYVCTSFS